MDPEQENLQEAKAFLSGIVQDITRFNSKEQNFIVAGLLESVRKNRAVAAEKAQMQLKEVEQSYSELNSIISKFVNEGG